MPAKRMAAGNVNQMRKLAEDHETTRARVDRIEERLDAEKHMNITDPPRYKNREVIELKDGKVQIRRVEDWGAFVVKVPYSYEPGLQDCEFKTWIQIEKERV